MTYRNTTLFVTTAAAAFLLLTAAPAAAQRCDSEYRTLDGSCTNTRFPTLGAAGQAIGSLFRLRHSSQPSGRGLPSARFVSNSLSKQDENVFNDRRLNELVTFFGQFVDHTCVLTPLSNERMDIPIPRDDPIFSNFSGGVLQFRRSQRVRIQNRFGRTLRGERPVNELSASMDLVSVYGVDEERAEALRTGVDGKLKTSSGNLLPLNTPGLHNAPQPSATFFLAGDERANENPALTSLHTLFVREHNTICTELKQSFPTWTDEELYENARKINIAQFQKIVFDEYFPAMTGRRLPRFRRFVPNADVSVLNEFSTAAFRVGHTLIGNVINRRGPGNAVLPSLPMQQMFFRPASFLAGTGIEEFIRGAANSRAQEVDLKVHNALRNFLFTGIRGEETAFDLIALNLQRGRDHALSSYNDIREKLGLGRAGSFGDITRNVNTQTALSTAYNGAVDRVEAWVGMMAEDHAQDSSFGRTLLAVWTRQLQAFRDGDAMYYENDELPEEIRRAIPRLNSLNDERDTLRAIILRNSGVTSRELPARSFFVELVDVDNPIGSRVVDGQVNK